MLGQSKGEKLKIAQERHQMSEKIREIKTDGEEPVSSLDPSEREFFKLVKGNQLVKAYRRLKRHSEFALLEDDVSRFLLTDFSSSKLLCTGQLSGVASR